MQIIGITGGVGAGKSAILDYLQENYRVLTLKADSVAHELMETGTDCYNKLKEILNEEAFLEDGSINRLVLSKLLFEKKRTREQINKIVHPAVKAFIVEKINVEKERDLLDYIVIEAALLIEDNYDEICDELWYVYASEEVRRRRLVEKRGYSLRRINQMFKSQLKDKEYRETCDFIIDNNETVEAAILQVTQRILKTNRKGETEGMEELQKNEHQLVFGLDIGTRNVVGTVGYKEDNEFFVVAQYSKEHDTRSMLDGQIHDIRKVGRTIETVKEALEQQIDQKLEEVCIAAAGRVLKTVTTTIEYEFPEETVVEGEHIHTLSVMGIEKAQQILSENNDTKLKFYCVGYSVVKYYLNDDVFSNLESHKADRISEDIIVTFLPEDVVDGLYAAVGFAGLTVANLTLEPIAAIHVAIPESFRMLNIAMVDIGAGTSDISITNDGSIIAYGMIPSAGDEITELIVKHYLVDFKTAEHIKCMSGIADEIEYKDIMSITHVIPAQEVWELVAPYVDKLAKDIAGKIKELNGGKTVSATFVVGGGGKIHDFTKILADDLELPYERVALRGEEVLQEVHFVQESVEKDPLIVTPVGICLVYYEQKNNFVFVKFNGDRIKLYDNGRLSIVDAAMQAGFPNEHLFPKRGKEINFTVNGRGRIIRGEAGESAVVKVNGRVVSMNAALEPNSDIVIEPSTIGESAICTLEQLEEYGSSGLVFEVNGRMVTCPKFAEVNGSLEPPYYEIQEGDQIEMRGYYSVAQVMEFMDVELDMNEDIYVNNREADLDTLVYENFSIDWTVLNYRTPLEDILKEQELKKEAETLQAPEIVKVEEKEETETVEVQATEMTVGEETIALEKVTDGPEASVFTPTQPEAEPKVLEKEEEITKKSAVNVIVNKEPVILTGKDSYIFVDIFDYISFDLHAGNGRTVVTKLNGQTPLYTQEINDGDVIEIYWE